MPAPTHMIARRHVTDAESFLAYYARFADERSIIMCNVDKGEFVATFDYHAPGKPAFQDHSLHYTCQQTQEWKTWNERSSKRMSQIEFAFFLEQNAREIVQPEGATILEIALTLTAKTNLSFKSGKRLADGQTQFRYEEELEGKAGANGDITIPDKIKLGLRVFEGCAPYEIDALFRWRLKDGDLTFWFDLVRPHVTYRAALDDVYTRIKTESGCTLMIHGT
jgi:uncharacterized protein YfdQ (DUF2303 family)